MHTKGAPKAANMNDHPYCTLMRTFSGTHLLLFSIDMYFGKSAAYSFHSIKRLRIRLNSAPVEERQKIYLFPIKCKNLKLISYIESEFDRVSTWQFSINIENTCY
jgi:hypothetical protein